ncbi:uncharacterized protein PHACADRAFT_201494 [Phanerochaete carnosa HHB-10118-sp]|uniref:Uncharacterized protein n=1 Tax=Phanerochaete carnosa (strain HHB-10118-sp) TaxID=650164 RepID=K5VTC9_PHACS|nr:uncharacterized protein PHACADRAFT_201494 [Phanerochaete carnosa HHB-10118-sp]EKM49794.1 hypothetical protein PHACADRAFT_201494 [Phanerochaete carnosa HHB-10118-sp]
MEARMQYSEPSGKATPGLQSIRADHRLIPLRGGFTSPYNDERRDKRQSLADPFADPFGDSEQSKTEKEREDADTLMAEIQQIIEYNVCDDEPEAGEGPFVVGDSDEEDVGSLSECSV